MAVHKPSATLPKMRVGPRDIRCTGWVSSNGSGAGRAALRASGVSKSPGADY
jgi:hypothetical protein